jgi:hypothetical protein
VTATADPVPVAAERTTPPRGASAPRRAVLLFAGLLLVLAAKGDGHFPIPRDRSEPLFEFYLLVLALGFCVGLILLLRLALGTSGPPQPVASRTAALVAALFAALDLAVLWLEAQRFVSYGYIFRPAVVAAVTLLPAGALCLLAVRQRVPRPGAVLAIAAAAYAGIVTTAIRMFPLSPERSNTLPVLVAAGHRLLSGHSPYVAYFLQPGAAAPLRAMPGLLLAFVPAPLLSLDPRIVGALWTLAAAMILFRRSGGAAAVYLAPFLLAPSLTYRHDLTLGPSLLLLAASWVALSRHRPVILGLCCGALLITSQLLLVPVAALAVFVYRREGGSALAKFLATAILSAGAVTLPFVLPDPRAFADGALDSWRQTRNLESLNLTYWIAALLPLPALRALQAAAVAVLLAARTRLSGTHLVSARPSPDFEGTGLFATLGGKPLDQSGSFPLWIDGGRRRSAFAVAALALTAFILLNTVVWTSFYFIALFLALLALLPRVRPASPTEPV